MPVPVKLMYLDDSESLVVTIEQSVVTDDRHFITLARNGSRIALLCAEALKDAQIVARLLVGIEIQPDGAAWRRGPRPPAQPTDHEGNIINKELKWTASGPGEDTGERS